MNAQERVARILCRLMDDEWQKGEQLYRNTADEIIATLSPPPNAAPREAGIQAFYADEGTSNTLQGLNAAFDAYEAAAVVMELYRVAWAAKEFIDDWKKGYFSLSTLAALDAQSLDNALTDLSEGIARAAPSQAKEA